MHAGACWCVVQQKFARSKWYSRRAATGVFRNDDRRLRVVNISEFQWWWWSQESNDKVPQKLKQIADIVYRFWLQKWSDSWKFPPSHPNSWPVFFTMGLTPSTPAVPNCCCSKGSAPYWSNPPLLIFDIRALWRSVLSARAPECQKLIMVG